MKGVRATAVQFRYLFATTDAGLQTIDITHPEKAVVLPSALVPLADARRVYLVRTYAYVAAGAEGLAIVDITKPEAPALLSKFTANGQIRDASDVKVGATNASLFAYVADGDAGLKVIQLMAPDTQPGFYGFSPEPRPQLIATHRTRMRRCRCPKVCIVIAQSTRPAARSRCSGASARGRSRSMKSASSSSMPMASPGLFPIRFSSGTARS